MSSEPPEEPLSRSEYNTLSPASPKPIHLPTPTDIPILNMQTDVGFNQTEAHPAMRNTETRPDMWQDPEELPTAPAQASTTIDASPYSHGAYASTAEGGDTEAGELAPQPETGVQQQAAEEMPASNPTLQPTPISYPTPNPLEGPHSNEVITSAQPTETPSMLPASDSSVPAATSAAPPDAFSEQTDEVKLDQPVSQRNGDAVNAQGLSDNLVAPSASNAASVPSNAPGVSAGSSPISASNLGPPSGLPPRPPPQDQPLINPNYAHSQHIRDYHPHATHSAYQPHGNATNQTNAADPSSRSFVPPAPSPGGNLQSANGAPPSAMYSPSAAAPSGQGMASYASTPASAMSSCTPGQGTFPIPYPQQAGVAGTAVGAASNDNPSRHAGRRPEDRPWDADVQRKYDRFLDEERRYVSEGRWEQFPQGSRLFVGRLGFLHEALPGSVDGRTQGNLSSERVTKRDIFHVFHTYGELAQISIKQAYGFVQFLRAEDCMTALEAEEGTQIRDKKIHLEVSKPQKNRPQPQQRRSRSPPDQRRQPGTIDRYNGNSSRAGTNRRDDYRPSRRSPSPPRGYRDRYDDRHRRRSPSPPPRGRYRSPTPEGDHLPLPRREPRDVPDVQILVVDDLDRDFIRWVETAFQQRGVRVDVLLLSLRLDEQAVVRRQIVEGVVAVVRLTRRNQESGVIGLQVFDRSAGARNVRFEEYDGLPPGTCAELVVREKGKVAAANAAPRSAGGYGGYGAAPPPQQQQQYGYQSGPPPPHQQGYPPQPAPGYQPTTYGQPSQAPAPPQHLQSLITNLDPHNLQSLLSAMGNSSATPQSAASNPYAGGQVQQQLPYAGGGQQQQMGAVGGGGGGKVNMQEILARLGSGGGAGGGGR